LRQSNESSKSSSFLNNLTSLSHQHSSTTTPCSSLPNTPSKNHSIHYIHQNHHPSSGFLSSEPPSSPWKYHGSDPLGSDAPCMPTPRYRSDGELLKLNDAKETHRNWEVVTVLKYKYLFKSRPDPIITQEWVDFKPKESIK